MTKLLSLSVASLIVLMTGIAFADPFSSTITSGSTITALRDMACGGTSDNYDVALPAGCTGDIDPATGNITVTNCTFAPASVTVGVPAIVTLSASSGSGNWDLTTLALTPDINVNVTSDPPGGFSCDSATPISPPLSGPVTGPPPTAGTISFSGSVAGPTFPVTPTCPPVVAGTLNCVLNTVTGATLNLTIP